MKPRGLMKVNDTYEGESIESLIAKRLDGVDIELGGKALLYTERKDGVLPETNIRTDRFDMIMMAHDALEKTRIAKRDAVPEAGKGSSKGESTQATDA